MDLFAKILIEPIRDANDLLKPGNKFENESEWCPIWGVCVRNRPLTLWNYLSQKRLLQLVFNNRSNFEGKYITEF